SPTTRATGSNGWWHDISSIFRSFGLTSAISAFACLCPSCCFVGEFGFVWNPGYNGVPPWKDLRLRRVTSPRRARAAQRAVLFVQALEERNPVSDLSHLGHAAFGDDTGPAPAAQSALLPESSRFTTANLDVPVLARPRQVDLAAAAAEVTAPGQTSLPWNMQPQERSALVADLINRLVQDFDQLAGSGVASAKGRGPGGGGGGAPTAPAASGRRAGGGRAWPGPPAGR